MAKKLKRGNSEKQIMLVVVILFAVVGLVAFLIALNSSTEDRTRADVIKSPVPMPSSFTLPDGWSGRGASNEPRVSKAPAPRASFNLRPSWQPR